MTMHYGPRRRRKRAVFVGHWRVGFWLGPTRLGVHTFRIIQGGPRWEQGSAGFGLFGINWIRLTKGRP